MDDCYACDECGEIFHWDFFTTLKFSNYDQHLEFCERCYENANERKWIKPDFCYFLINKTTNESKLFTDWEKIQSVIDSETYKFGYLTKSIKEVPEETLTSILKAPADKPPAIDSYCTFDDKKRFIDRRNDVLDDCTDSNRWLITKDYFNDKIHKYQWEIEKLQSKMESL